MFFTKEKQQAFLEDICLLIEDGVPAPQAIVVIFKVSTGVTREAAHAIMNAVAQGKNLADGMEEWFPQSIVEIIRSGEDGGSLAKSIKTAANTLTQQISALSSIISSIAYPLVVLIAACIVAVFLKNNIFVAFSSIKPLSQWPDNGKTFMAVSDFIQGWWWAVLIFIAAMFVTITYTMRNLIGDTRKIFDKIPLFSLYRDYVASGFMEILGLLISNGMPFKNVLSIVQNKATRYLSWHIYMMQFRLSGGRDNLADVLNTGLISNSDIERLRAMAQSKSFEHSLIQLGSQAAKKNVQKLCLTGKILGGFLLALGASFAIFMIFAVYGVGISIGS